MTAQEAQLDELAVLAARGDAGATSAVLARIRPMVVRYCRARLGRTRGGAYANADDVAQEVCIAVLRALPRYRDMGRPFVAFVFGIAGHKVTDAYRAAARDLTDPVDQVPESPVDPSEDPEHQALRADAARRLGELLNQLPRHQREIVLLRVAVGMTADQVGAALGMSAGAVRVAQHRALARLRRLAAEVADEVRV